MRVQYLKRLLETQGHQCVVLNIGQSRKIPSTEYETVLGPLDYARKVWRYALRGFTAHIHVNGASPQGFVLALFAEVVNLLCGRRCVLTFHAGVEQVYFPRARAPRLALVFWLMFTIPRTIVCNSEAVKERICEYGVSPAKVVPIQAFSRQYLEFERVDLPRPLEDFLTRLPRVVFCYINLRPLFHPVTVVEGFAGLAQLDDGVGLVLCGTSAYPDETLRRAVDDTIGRYGLSGRILLVDDLDHDSFLTALTRAFVFLRSHISDGVCSSVLEAMALGIPVVASENGQRPAGVLTYRPDDPDDLARTLRDVCVRRAEVASAMPRPHIPDTLAREAELLVVS